MNNLKRVLALGLTGTMLTGLMLTGAGAVGVSDFTDGEDITNQEAVTTMAALGVILGKDTGAFDPAGNVTRAEMAKMITVMLNGGKDPVLGTKATPTYSDIDNHWAESYIEYCTTEGVISGQGDGTFNPDGSVTGSQAAKMSLVALGYDSSAYNFTGIDWEVNTNRIANSEADLYDGLETLDPTQPLNRDNAAQMLFNVLDATTKKMTPTTSTNGSIEYTYTDGGSFMQEKFGAVKVEGVVTGNEMAVLTSSSTGSHLDANRTRILVTNYGTGNGEQTSFGNAAGTAAVTVQAATGLDELGRKVSVYVKSGSSSSKADIMGDVIVSEDNVVVTDYSGDSIATVASDNNLNLTSTQTARNYANVADYASSVAGNSTRGVEKILIDNDDDGDVDYVLLNTYRLGRVTSYVTSGDGSITVSVSTDHTRSKSDRDDVVGFDDVARNDYVLMAEIGDRLHVEKAETVTGTLTGYRQSDPAVAADIGTGSVAYTNRLSIDDTNYTVAALVGYTGGSDNLVAAYSYGPNNLDNEATFYLGKGDCVLGVGEVVSNAYNYALVLAKDSGINNQVRVALADGTVATYTLTASGSNVKFVDVKIGEVYAYTLSSSGNIRLNNPVRQAADMVASNVTFSKGRTSVGVNGSTYYANSSTAFFYVSDTQTPGTGITAISSDAVDVYTGYASAPSLTAGSATASVYTRSATSGETAYTSAAVVVFRGANLATANVDDNMYVYSKGNSSSDYTNVAAFVAGSAEAETALKATGDVTAEGIRTYTMTSEGYYDLSTPGTYTAAIPVTNSTGNLITGAYTNGASDWTVSSSTANTFVMTKGSTSYELEVNADTMLVNDSSYLDDPTAELGAAPNEDDNIAYVLFSLDAGVPDVAKLIVIKNSNSATTTPPATDPSVVVVASSVDGGDYSAPLFYRATGAAVTPAQMVAALNTKMVADGCTDVSFNGFESVTYKPAGSSSNITVYFNGGNSGSLVSLTRAANQGYKVTLNGTAGYYIAGKTFKTGGNVVLAGTNCYINGSSTPTLTSTGHTVTAGDTDTTIVDGYYSHTATATGTVSGSVTGLTGATVTYGVATGCEKGIVTVTLTSSVQSTAPVVATVTGSGVVTADGVNVFTIATGAFTGSGSTWTTTITVPVSNDIGANGLTIVLSNPT